MAGMMEEMYVWLYVDPNGTESIISSDLETPFGPRHMPLMSSNRATVNGDKIKALADAACFGKPGTYHLATFVRMPTE